METETWVLLGIILVAPFFAVALRKSWIKKRKQRLIQVWQQVADQRGLTLDPETMELSGECQGRQIHLELVWQEFEDREYGASSQQYNPGPGYQVHLTTSLDVEWALDIEDVQLMRQRLFEDENGGGSSPTDANGDDECPFGAQVPMTESMETWLREVSAKTEHIRISEGEIEFGFPPMVSEKMLDRQIEAALETVRVLEGGTWSEDGKPTVDDGDPGVW